MADVKVDVKVDDKGSLNQVGKSAQSARRQIGGVAKTASASGKQFSKMSQGITGGLVPAYAQLAATLFAVDAVFRTLKESADLRVQREGMVAFAANTGTALKVVADRLREATEAQLDFAAAARGSAIGMAAGLTSAQMEEIGKAANLASKALGVNFTDAFNRLLRGITKGEPELLDELGIILRLDTATREYAQANNISKDSLTALQRTQAVHANVMGQVADKYAGLGDAVEPSKIQQLGIALENLKQNVLISLAPIAEFFAGVLANNISATIALMGTFAASVLRKIIPSMSEMQTKARGLRAEAEAATRARQVQARASRMAVSRATRAASPSVAMQAQTQAAAQAFGSTKSATLARLQEGEKLNKLQEAQLNRMLRNAENQYRKHGKIVTGYLKGQNIKRVTDLKASLSRQQVSWKVYGDVVVAKMKRVGVQVGAVFKGMEAAATRAFANMSLAANAVGRAFSRILALAGWIGIAVMIVQVFKGLKDEINAIMNSIAKSMENMGRRLGLSGLTKLGRDIQTSIQEGEAANAAEKRQKKLKNATEEWNSTLQTSVNEMEKILKLQTEARDIQEEMIRNKNWAQTMGGTVKKKLSEFMTNENFQQAYVTGAVDNTALMDLVGMGLAAGSGYGKILQEYADYLTKARNATQDEEIFYGYKEGAKEFLKMLDEYIASESKPGQALEQIGQGYLKSARMITEGNKQLGSTSTDNIITQLTEDIKNSKNAILEEGHAKAAVSKTNLEYALLLGATSEKIKTNADAYAYLESALKDYVNIQKEERRLRLSDIGLQTDMANASKYRGALGAHLKREIKLKQNINAVDRANNELQKALRVDLTALEGQQKTDAEDRIAQARELLALEQAKRDAYRESTSILGQMTNSLSMGIEKMFTDLATGAATLKDALKSLFHSMLLDLAKILAKQAAIRAMSAVFGLERGGIIPMAKGGMIPKYGMGGVATEPTYLVGEGRNHEAVVPLPDNRSIPVKLQGDTGGTNNVTVNVDATGGSTTTSVGDAQARQLGQMVAAAVQAEIIDQKRPGGILSPFGDGDY